MSQYCVLNAKGVVRKSERVPSTAADFKHVFGKLPRARIALEACGISAWVERELKALGHEVYVANPRNVALISKSYKKSDRKDAEMLARIVAADPKLLSPITHRGEKAQFDLAKIKLRDVLVRNRVNLVASLRGILEIQGIEIPRYSTESFHKKLPGILTRDQFALAKPVLESIECISSSIREFDREIERAAKKDYPETELFRSINGVGAITALAFALTIDDPKRFKKSRDVCAFLGLTPKTRQSGDSDPELRITKAGNKYLRKLLVQCAHYILGPFGHDSDLREWGLKLAARGAKNAKKRALVAVARKLAMILHRMWITKTEYIPRRHEPHVVIKHTLKTNKQERKRLAPTV